MGFGRRASLVLLVAFALSFLPPLKMVAPADTIGTQPSAISWQMDLAQAQPLSTRALSLTSGSNRLDPAEARIGLGSVLILIALLGGTTLMMWAGAVRRRS